MNRRGFLGKLALLPLVARALPALAEKSPEPPAPAVGPKRAPGVYAYTSERVHGEPLSPTPRRGYFVGQLAYSPIAPGSLTLAYFVSDHHAPFGSSIRDDGNGGFRPDHEVVSGWIDYRTGKYELVLKEGSLAARAEAVVANYDFSV